MLSAAALFEIFVNVETRRLKSGCKTRNNSGEESDCDGVPENVRFETHVPPVGKESLNFGRHVVADGVDAPQAEKEAKRCASGCEQ